MSDSELAARLLARSWEPAGVVADEPGLDAAVTLLLQTGCGALGWRQVKGTPFASTPSGQRLRDAARTHALDTAVLEDRLKTVTRALAQAGLAPILCKGWSVARLYPEPHLRPYGDLDLWLPRDQRARAAELLADAGDVDIDDHDLDTLAPEEVAAHARTVELDGVPVRVLSPEHQLRTLCLHQLRHALWRPLWLVDVAVMVERLDADFDWDRCLFGPRHVRDGVEVVIGLARELLGARVPHGPDGVRVRRLPRWLVPAVLERWPLGNEHYYDGVPLAERLFDPRALAGAIRRRWPSPIEATVSRRAPFNDWPRWPIQVADCAVRFAGFVVRLPRSLAAPRAQRDLP